jgi:hypothetical protein
MRKKTPLQKLRYLEKLGQKLATLAPELKSRFSLYGWGRDDTAMMGDYKHYRPLKLKQCGTAACACGWAPKRVPESGMKHKRGRGYTPFYGKLESWDAVTECFGIRAAEAIRLFDVDHYKPEDIDNPVVVSKRILSFVERKRAKLRRAK